MSHLYKSSPQKTTHHVVAVGVFFGRILMVGGVCSGKNHNFTCLKLYFGVHGKGILLCHPAPELNLKILFFFICRSSNTVFGSRVAAGQFFFGSVHD